MNKPTVENAVRTSNDLLSARYAYTSHEIDMLIHIMRCVNATNANGDHNQYCQITIPVDQVVESFGESGRLFEYIRASLRGISKKPFEFFTDGKWTICNFISFAGVDAIRRQIIVRVDVFMVQYLRDLKKNYSSFELKSILMMQSIYGKRIYMMLCQFRSTGMMQINVDELKKRLSIEDKYSLIADLKKRVIMPALQEINVHSELNVELHEVRAGKLIDHLHFSFAHKHDVVDVMGDEKQIKFMIHSGLANWQIENVIMRLRPNEIHDVLMCFQNRLRDRTKQNVTNKGAYLCSLFVQVNVPMHKQLPKQLKLVDA